MCLVMAERRPRRQSCLTERYIAYRGLQMLAASRERQHREATQANHSKVTEWLRNVDVEGTLIFSDIVRPVK